MIFTIFGWLADQSHWMLCGISVALWSLASGGSGFASTFGILMATRMFVGIGEAGYGPAAARRSSPMSSQRADAPVRCRCFIWPFLSAAPLGYVLGGVIAAHFNGSAPPSSR